MVNKTISDYTAETTPASTDKVLIDQGAGAYKYCTLANLLNYGDVSIPNGYLYIGAGSADVLGQNLGEGAFITHSAGSARFFANGADASTRGDYVFYLQESDGGNSVIAMQIDKDQNVTVPNGELSEGGVRVATGDGTTGGSASAGAGNQYVEISIAGTTYKVLHDGTV